MLTDHVVRLSRRNPVCPFLAPGILRRLGVLGMVSMNTLPEDVEGDGGSPLCCACHSTSRAFCSAMRLPAASRARPRTSGSSLASRWARARVNAPREAASAHSFAVTVFAYPGRMRHRIPHATPGRMYIRNLTCPLQGTRLICHHFKFPLYHQYSLYSLHLVQAA